MKKDNLPFPALLLSQVKKIAILRPNAVGDFVFSLPCLHALRQRYTEAQIVYIGREWHADFLAGRPGPVDRVVVMPPCPGIGMPPEEKANAQLVQTFIDAMQRMEFDLAVQVYGGGQYSNPFITQWGARLTIGMKAIEAAPLDRSVFYGPLQNRRLQMLEVATLAGASLFHMMERELEVTDKDRREAAAVCPPVSSRRLILLQPGASDARRCWPAVRFAAVADTLASTGACIAVNGTLHEESIVREVIAHMRYPAVDLCGKLSLSGLCGLLERTDLLLSNDTGPLHLALAIGTPCVGIYWLDNLIEGAPLRQGRHRPALSIRTRCPVCGMENRKARCAHEMSFVEDVSVEEVTDLALELFNQEYPVFTPSAFSCL